MEEKEMTTPKLTYEQLEKVATQLNQRVLVAETKLKTIDFTVVRLTYLFKVLENNSLFSQEFLNKCVKEIEGLLTLEEETPKPEKD